ncbi:hypothetical protein [Spirosoma arcticum]
MIRLIFTLMITLPCAALPWVASAQSEVYFQQPPTDRNLAGLTSGELTIVQTGQLNQLRYGEAGTGNTVRLSQQGTNNALDLEVTGTGNQYDFAQQGDNNVAQWRTGHQNNDHLEVLQRGNNNQLIQEGSVPAAGVPMRIEQTGGMQLLLKNGY